MTAIISKLLRFLKSEPEEDVRGHRIPLSPEEVARIQTRILAMQNAAQRTAAEYLRVAQAFVDRHTDLLSTFAPGDETLAARVQRTLSGISRAIRQFMPSATRKAGTGRLLLNFRKQDAIASWDDGSSKAISLMHLITQSADRFGEFSRLQCEEVAKLILSDLGSGMIALPEFSLSSSEGDSSIWAWRRHDIRLEEVDTAAAKAELEKLLREAQPELEEAGLI